MELRDQVAAGIAAGRMLERPQASILMPPDRRSLKHERGGRSMYRVWSSAFPHDPRSTVYTEHPDFTAVRGDITSSDSMRGTIAGAHAVFMSVRGNGPDNEAEQTVNNRALLTFIEEAHRLGSSAPRVIQVGNQATLYRNGVLGLNTGPYEGGPPRHGCAWAHALVLDNYRATTDDDWIAASASGSIRPGERTGTYRRGEDEVLLEGSGEKSGISEENYAVGLVDEIENSNAIRKRIAFGY